MIVHNYLKSYKSSKFQVLSNDTDFDLEVMQVWFWGLYKRRKIVKMTLTPLDDYGDYFIIWDSFIETQKAISLRRR